MFSKSQLGLILIASAVAFAQQGGVSAPSVFIGGAYPYYISIGQSLSVGTNGDPATSTTQPYSNREWNGSPSPIYPTSTTSLQPLVEATVETHMSGFANQMGAYGRANGFGSFLDSVQGSWGVPGTGYNGLKKGTVPYNNSISALSAAIPFLKLSVVPALLAIHGESDAPSSSYESYLVQWQSDYQTDIQAITHQTSIIPLFSSQCNCAGGDWPGGILNAFEDHPTTLPLVGPKYFFTYSSDNDPHLINSSYLWLGEYYAKAVYKQVVQGQQWSPLRPSSISVSGSAVTIHLTGFVAPIVFDTTTLPLRANYGFEWSGTETITSVVLTDATNGIITLNLSGTPTLTNQLVRYAYGQAPGYPPSHTNRWGNVHDSDPAVGRDGNTLWNWLCNLDKPYNFVSPF